MRRYDGKVVHESPLNDDLELAITPPVNRWKGILTLLMLVAWLPSTSHALLEGLGVIHEENSPATDFDHAAADGMILLPSRVDVPAMNFALVLIPVVIRFFLPEPIETRPVLRIHAGTSPPGPNSWQFVHRAALPARAPSFAS